MNIKNNFIRYTLSALILLSLATISFAQKSNQPRQEKLLNGLKLLTWNDTATDKVTVKLRIHSGAAFDTQNKEGTMALLADALFPNDTVKEFFREDLGGSLEVVSNYDYIQINATGDADQVLTILETIAAAVTKTQIDKDTTTKLKAARLERIQELEKNPSYVADQAVAKRLFGNYPYGRSAEGTAESLAKIDFADLILARQRFLTADNSTLAVSGNVKYDYVYKVVRQLFGGWEKSDKRIPASFAEASAPDTKFYLIKSEINNASELRFAFRAASRRDADFQAARLLTQILQNRLQKKENGKVSVQQNSYFLPGLVVVKFSEWNSAALKVVGEDVSMPENFLNYVQDLLASNVSAEELQMAKSDLTKANGNQNIIDAWLDADSYQYKNQSKTDAPAFQNSTLADAQRVLERWRKEAVVRTLLFKAISLNYSTLFMIEKQTADELKHAKAVREMFSGIATKYDFLNHFLSVNIDKRWRRLVSQKIKRRFGKSARANFRCRLRNRRLIFGVAERREGESFRHGFLSPDARNSVRQKR